MKRSGYLLRRLSINNVESSPISHIRETGSLYFGFGIALAFNQYSPSRSFLAFIHSDVRLSKCRTYKPYPTLTAITKVGTED